MVVKSKEDVGREEEDKTRKYVSQETLDNNGSHQLTPHEKSGRSVREPGSDETPLSDFRGGKTLDSKHRLQYYLLFLLTRRARHHPRIHRRLLVNVPPGACVVP